jgi:hypothetical protein
MNDKNITRVKSVSGYSVKEFEKNINATLTKIIEEDKCKVVDIKYQMTTSKTFATWNSALVLISC